MRIISGKEVAASITENIKNEVERLTAEGKRPPKLVIIRVGDNPNDLSYQRGAIKRMDMAGIEHEEIYFGKDISKEDFYNEFERINTDEGIDGILVLRPLPPHLDENRLIHSINQEKDIDAINPASLGKIMTKDEESFAPCTAAGVIEMLKFSGVSIEGKRVTVIGRSNVVGKPLALLFISENATVTVCHSFTKDLKEAGKNAEILVAACGKAKLIDSGYVSKDAVVVDVGINFDENGNLCGDVDIKDIEDIASACTPVPGGVGAVTTSILAKQVLTAYRKKLEK